MRKILPILVAMLLFIPGVAWAPNTPAIPLKAPTQALGTPTLNSTTGFSVQNGVTQPFTVTIAHNCTLDLSTTSSVWGASGNQFNKVLFVTNGGSNTITWTGVTWEGTASTSTPPSLAASGVNCILFVTEDGGTTVYGIQVW